MSAEYDAGYDAGYKAGRGALAALIWRNRNHFAALLGYAPETQEEAITRVFGNWPPTPPPRRDGAPFVSGNPVKDAEIALLAGVDMYVIPPADGVIEAVVQKRFGGPKKE